MKTRRGVLQALLAGGAVVTAAHASTYSEVMKAGRPKLIRGTPNKVDFGHGLLVPMSRDAFETLWEGDDRWMAYGHGMGKSDGEAMGRAEEAAIATMKLFLLTLAFAPDRLVRVDGGGWRLKSGRTADLVRGDIDLPGRPVMPTTDQMPDFLSGETGEENPGNEAVHATTGWVIWKKDVTLDYVRAHAQLVPPDPAAAPAQN